MESSLKKTLYEFQCKLLLVYALGLMILLALSLITNFVMKDQAAEQAASLIARIVKRGDPREVIFTLANVQFEHFSSVTLYGKAGEQIFSLPANLNPMVVSSADLWANLWTISIDIPIYLDELQKYFAGRLIFRFNRFAHVPFAIGIWLFFFVGTLPMVSSLRRGVAARFEREVEIQSMERTTQMAKKVRHNIKAPIGALQAVLFRTKSLEPGEKNLVRGIIDRLRNIVSELEVEIKMESFVSCYLEELVDEVIEEKGKCFPEKIFIEKESKAKGIAVLVRPNELKTTLSNILENARQAMPKGGRILVSVLQLESGIEVRVSDQGVGIRPEDLPYVTDRGFTKGKLGGSGLGLHYALQTLAEHNGNLLIESEVHRGTTVTMKLPVSEGFSLSL